MPPRQPRHHSSAQGRPMTAARSGDGAGTERGWNGTERNGAGMERGWKGTERGRSETERGWSREVRDRGGQSTDGAGTKRDGEGWGRDGARTERRHNAGAAGRSRGMRGAVRGGSAVGAVPLRPSQVSPGSGAPRTPPARRSPPGMGRSSPGPVPGRCRVAVGAGGRTDRQTDRPGCTAPEPTRGATRPSRGEGPTARSGSPPRNKP